MAKAKKTTKKRVKKTLEERLTKAQKTELAYVKKLLKGQRHPNYLNAYKRLTGRKYQAPKS